MTSTYAGDAFFDSDNEDQGPNLTGEYNRGNTPPAHNLIKPTGNPSAGSSTSGHFSSDSPPNMSKTNGTTSRYSSRSRSPSSRTRTPSGSTYRYSDSFDSEASGDSRRSSPTRSRRGRGGGKRKSGGDTARRFDSGTSRDSRLTFRSTNSSVYGKTNKKSKWLKLSCIVIRQISLHVQRRIRVDVGHVFGVRTNPYLKINYSFEIFHQPAVKLYNVFSF